MSCVRIHQNQFSVSAVILDRCNAVAGEQVPDALLSLGVLAPIHECQGDPYPPAEPYESAAAVAIERANYQAR